MHQPQFVEDELFMIQKYKRYLLLKQLYIGAVLSRLERSEILTAFLKKEAEKRLKIKQHLFAMCNEEIDCLSHFRFLPKFQKAAKQCQPVL